jgi:hypothetical protein
MRRVSGIPIQRLLVGAGVLLVLLYPFAYIGMFAGDAEIHLVFGENAAKGHFFEFNPGEKVSGETSPGYMLLVAAFFKLAPAALVPAIMKGLGFLSWYGLLVLVFLTAARLLPHRAWAYVATLVAGLLPGSAFNATYGMENGLFAFVIFLFIYLVIRWRWLSPGQRVGHRQELLLGTLLGMASWLRPEGLVVAFLALTFRALLFGRVLGSVNAIFMRLLLPSIAFLFLAAGLVLFHTVQTGDLLPASGMSRVLHGSRHAFFLGPVWFSPKFLVRLMFYLPITGFWLIGNWVVLSRRRGSGSNAEGLLIVTFWVFFFMYSMVLGTAMFARYVIFAMPMMVIIAGVGAAWLWTNWATVLMKVPTVIPVNRPQVRVAGFLLLTAGLVAVFTVETLQRRHLSPLWELPQAMRAPALRQEYSDKLLASLGDPPNTPVSIAYQEIQVRYWLDDRFVVRSLDGRVDRALINHVQEGNFDHIGYVKERQVRYIMETPNYNRDQDLWSLQRLADLKVGEVVSREGLRFTRLPPDSYGPRQVSYWTTVMAYNKEGVIAVAPSY